MGLGRVVITALAALLALSKNDGEVSWEGGEGRSSFAKVTEDKVTKATKKGI
jgi:hypothetical protein